MVALEEDQVKNVLMAEDDDDDFELFADALKELSLQLILKRAENGEVLMKILHEQLPDMLFLDILMPCKNGKDCLLEIRENKKFDHLPIIVFSGLRNFNSIEFCFRKGTNLFVYKPHTYTELLELIRRIFAINWKHINYYPTRADFVFNKFQE